MPNESNLRHLAELLKQAGVSHHEAFAESDGEDPEWPLWYAKFLEDGVEELLGTRPTRSRLVQCLLNAEERHGASGDDRPWHEFYAEYILGLGEDLATTRPEPE